MANLPIMKSSNGANREGDFLNENMKHMMAGTRK